MSQGCYDRLSQDEKASLARETAEREERDLLDFLHDARTEGEAKGKAKASHEIAANMLQKGCDSSLISEVTGLSDTEISRLKNGR